jgi:hypothetical protein
MREEKGDRVMWVSQVEMLDDLWKAREERDRLQVEVERLRAELEAVRGE